MMAYEYLAKVVVEEIIREYDTIRKTFIIDSWNRTAIIKLWFLSLAFPYSIVGIFAMKC